ncbi:tetrapyrrole methylase [Imleria badia]|nr:tetrapyrrole methylase [Imleria badia]
MPELCDFSFTATHRFVDPVSSSKTPLQIGVTTNGEGCRLAGRVRREIVAGLSKDVGAAVTKVAWLRKMAKKISKENEAPADGEGGEDCTVTTPNSPVPIRAPGGSTSEESSTEAARRQMRHADIVLSDKLVPAPVLELIPPHVEVRIARKFPGNADGAQTEMMVAAVEAANRGLTVVRLKQGDPIVYARAGEELAYFRAHGYAPLILPGLSSALAAPACAGIPVTHRGVAESFVVCTGVGRQGKAVSLPGYDRARTVLVLMGVARLGEVVRALIATEHGGRRDGLAYPAYLPIAIIERGLMPDQRVLVSTLEDVESALAGVEQRPPGMIVIGWAVMAFGRRDGEGGDAGEGILADVEVDAGGQERRDRLRIAQWLGGRKWDVWEGLGTGWEGL